MEFPVIRPLPEDEPLHVEGNAAVRLFLAEPLIVARGHVWSAVAFPQPIPIDFDFHVPARRPEGDDLSRVRTEGLVARITLAAVLLGIPSRAIRRLDAIAVQGDSVDLDERREDCATDVRDRTRGRERPFERDPPRGRVTLIPAAAAGLVRIGPPEDVLDRDQIGRTAYIGIPRRQSARRRGLRAV